MFFVVTLLLPLSHLHIIQVLIGILEEQKIFRKYLFIRFVSKGLKNIPQKYPIIRKQQPVCQHLLISSTNLA